MASRRVRSQTLILLVVAGLAFVVIATSLAVSQLLRERETESWRYQMDNMSLLLAGQLEQSLVSSRIAMDSIADRVDSLKIRDAADLRARAGVAELHQMLRDKVSGLPQIDVATIVADNGDVLNFTRSFPPPPINLADRDYFQVQRDDPGRGLFISLPVRNKGNGKWVFYLSRRLNDTKGQFIGLVLVGISVEQLIQHFARLGTSLGAGSSISFYRRDFSLMARWPWREEFIGVKNLTGNTHQVVEGLKLNSAVIFSDSSRIFENGRQEARLGAVRVLEHLPLIINLTVTEELFLTNWRQSRRLIMSVAGGSVLALLVAGLVLLRLVRQREKSAALLRDLADQVPGFLMQMHQSKDGALNFTYANQRLLEYSGLQESDLPVPSERLLRWVLPEDRPGLEAALAHSARTLDPWRAEYRVQKPDGPVIWRHGDAMPMRQPDGSVLWHGYVSDITAQREATEELQTYRLHLEELVRERTAALLATEARSTQILNSTADGLYGLDRDGRITFINPAACKMLGLEAETVTGQRAHDLFHHHRADGSEYPREDCVGFAAVIDGQAYRCDEEVYWHSDGHPIPVMYAIHPIEVAGQIDGAVVSFVDISAQKTAAAALERAVREAETLARLRSEFLANMSHEIRTPMNGVLGFASIGLRNLDKPEKVRNALEKITISGNLLLGIINDILDLSKIEAGKTKIELQSVPLLPLVEHALELVRDRADSKNLKLELIYADDLPQFCRTDSLRLSQVLLNLLGNAVKFTEQGWVELAVRRQGDQLHFQVTDTGIGINPEHLPLLFNPFQQADGSMTRRFGGTGLGLAICKRIVELLGGEIRVSSEEGVGSRFEFEIPCQARAGSD